MRIHLLLSAFLLMFHACALHAQQTTGFHIEASSLIAPNGFQNPYYINGTIRPSVGLFRRVTFSEKIQIQAGLLARMSSFKRFTYNPPGYTYRDPIIYHEHALFIGAPVEAIVRINPRVAASFGFETLFNLYSVQRGEHYEIDASNQLRLVEFHEKSTNASLISIAPSIGLQSPLSARWEAFIKCAYSLTNYYKSVTPEDDVHFLSVQIGVTLLNPISRQ